MSGISNPTTFFGETDVNRVSFLRSDPEFVRSALSDKSSIFVPFISGEALMEGKDLLTINLGAHEELQTIIHKLLPLLNTKEIRIDASGVGLTFLGLKETLDSSFEYKSTYKGTPYFGINFELNDDTTLIKLQDISLLSQYRKVGREDIFKLSNDVASLYSHAKMYLDWLSKYKFCPGCGSVVYPIDAGTKLQCSNEDTSIRCNVRDANVNNVCFPRTDPVVIVAMTSRDFSKICLARSRRRYGDFIMYSTIAGFMEPAETVENACTREIWEETGIRCNEISMICTQPWPYPVNLMIGCLGIVDFNGINEKISLDHDAELLDAQWFDTEEVTQYLDKYTGGSLLNFKDGIVLPGETAVAYQLISYVCGKFKKANDSKL
ncbi:NAD(+) diphosphatase NDAI_0I00760 [Naumovozyma dairenensis CBS 421]|uniref:NAD(+) diphosphatase n=1 Tax=Naumovozyma dairenensis (strain ATCC 10597 / BCRC 20456 / CBS 421 / NBRC 0211 / NRRL Y-12639) TaxID=1071378 RepID=G0WFT4_NAUDC|nr:hypothetical protein NDAI_0I00760 [Naumovozyma dairenensis CBS 421]CCD26645.1 hypothetical protein NDAI_0I00760 [Naumovozyma dairenensis CBS 421]